MRPKFCGKCGNTLKIDDKFCYACGWEIISFEQENSLNESGKKVGEDTTKAQSSDQGHKDAVQKEQQPPRIPTSSMQPTESFHQQGSAQTTSAGQNKRLNKGLIIGLSAGAGFLILIMLISGFFIWRHFRNQSAFPSTEVSDERISADSPREDIQDETQSVLDGKWFLISMIESVSIDNKESGQHAGMVGEKQVARLMFDMQQGIANMVEEYTGIELPLPCEQKADQVTIGSADGENNAFYKGTISSIGQDMEINGSWQSSADSENMLIKGSFKAVKAIPLISLDIIGSAANITLEDLRSEGMPTMYQGSLTWQKIQNIDKLPQENAPENMKQLLKDIEGRELECIAELKSNYMDVRFIYEGNELELERFYLDDMHAGVLETFLVEDDTVFGLDGFMRTQIVVTDHEGIYKIYGASQVNGMLPDGDYFITLINFDLSAPHTEIAGDGFESDGLQQDGSTQDSSVTQTLNALSYIPTPGDRYSFVTYYPNGEQELEENWIGKLDDCQYCTVDILSSELAFLEGNDYGPISMYHYSKGIDGIYLHFHGFPEYKELWLPNDYHVGLTWGDDLDGTYTILETEVVVELSDMVFDDCIVRGYRNDNLGVDMVEYLAPNYGIIKRIHTETLMTKEMISVGNIDIEHANNVFYEYEEGSN